MQARVRLCLCTPRSTTYEGWDESPKVQSSQKFTSCEQIIRRSSRIFVLCACPVSTAMLRWRRIVDAFNTNVTRFKPFFKLHCAACRLPVARHARARASQLAQWAAITTDFEQLPEASASFTFVFPRTPVKCWGLPYGYRLIGDTQRSVEAGCQDDCDFVWSAAHSKIRQGAFEISYCFSVSLLPWRHPNRVSVQHFA